MGLERWREQRLEVRRRAQTPGREAKRNARAATDAAFLAGGRLQYAVEYDPRTASLRVAGRTLFLGAGNVILLDRVDGVGGAPAVRTAGCIALDSSRTVMDRALALPAARAFAP